MAVTVGADEAGTRRELEVGGKTYGYYSIPAAEAAGLGDFSRLPAALKWCWRTCSGFPTARR